MAKKKKTKKKTSKSKTSEKPPGYIFGRPTKYKAEFCQKLYDHMKAGKSFETFGHIVGVSAQTLYGWKDKHPDFFETACISKSSAYYWWEALGQAGTTGQVRGFNATSWGLNMRNRFDFHNGRTEITGRDGLSYSIIFLIASFPSHYYGFFH